MNESDPFALSDVSAKHPGFYPILGSFDEILFAWGLACVGGFIDGVGFVALGGTFFASVTGNMVIAAVQLAAHHVEGSLVRLSSLPLYIAATGITLVVIRGGVSPKRRRRGGHPEALVAVLIVETLLLLIFATICVSIVTTGDAAPSPGIVLVCLTPGIMAMAVQTAMMRECLPFLAPTTVMTGNVTQMVLDAARLALREDSPHALVRIRRMARALTGFFLGAVSGAATVHLLGLSALFLPVILVAVLAQRARGHRVVPRRPRSPSEHKKIGKVVRARGPLVGVASLPGDKSISHRALILAVIAEGESILTNVSVGDDVTSTRRCLTQLGARIEPAGDTLKVAAGWAHLCHTLAATDSTLLLDCGNSGTTARLMMALLSHLPIRAILTGDASLRCRPMRRVAEPLRHMGADIALAPENTLPAHMQGRQLSGQTYALPLPSGQLKSALLFAGVLADGTTTLTGALKGRDHGERLLKAFGAKMTADTKHITVRGPQNLRACDVAVPQDISAAAYICAAAAVIKGSAITLYDVGLNPTRLGFLQALRDMGARIVWHVDANKSLVEPQGEIHVSAHAKLNGITLTKDKVPELIDELPLLAIVATMAHGQTQVSGAQELRVKESDRIAAVCNGLKAMHCDIKAMPDGFVIKGPQKLVGARVDCMGDHRIAMAFAVAAMFAKGETTLVGAECVRVSDPQFFARLEALTPGPNGEVNVHQ